MGHAGPYLHWRRQGGGLAHWQSWVLVEHGTYDRPHKNFKAHKGRPRGPWQANDEGLPTLSDGDTPPRTGGDTTKEELGTESSHSTRGEVMVATP